MITSRSEEVALELVKSRDILKIDVMDQKQSLDLLKTRMTVDADAESDAPALIEQLGRLPLAIIHAGSYMATRRPKISISKYRQLFEDQKSRNKLLGLTALKDDRRDFEAARTIMATFFMSFEALKKENAGATDLLALMCMWDNQSIPELLLQPAHYLMRHYDIDMPYQ